MMGQKNERRKEWMNKEWTIIKIMNNETSEKMNESRKYAIKLLTENK